MPGFSDTKLMNLPNNSVLGTAGKQRPEVRNGT
jgi:hypothetical protein